MRHTFWSIEDIFPEAIIWPGMPWSLAEAILARKFVADEIPDKDLVIKIYTHDLKSLVTQAGLEPFLKERMAVDDRFSANWEIVRGWNEGSRYVINTDENARTLLEAVSDQTSGVFPWIQAHW